jgi:ketosteroid isomerase-like protein
MTTSLSHRRLGIGVALAIGLHVGALDLQAQTEAEIVSVVDAYHTALAAGDSATALSLLAEDVVILESGGVETKAQYRSGHLSGDMRFAQAVPRERSDITVQVMDDVAWAWSTSVTEGRMGEREINSQGAELMVLARVGGDWRITAIHWSSRQRR